MKISQKYLSILSILEFTPIEKSAKNSSKPQIPDYTTRYLIKKFLKNNIITNKRPIISNEALGYFFVTIFFSLHSSKQKEKQALIKHLSRAEEVSWFFELGGDFQYGLSLKVKSISGINTFLESVVNQFGNIFFDKIISTQVFFAYFGRRYLSREKVLRNPLIFSLQEKSLELDNLDQRIINGLTDNNYESYAELSRQLKIPLTTLERRRTNLEELGIIKGYFYWINTEKLEISAYVIVIFAQGINPKLKEELLSFSKHEQNIVYITECLGQWDFEIGVEVFNPKDITKLTEKIYDKFSSSVKTLRVIPLLNYLKFKSYEV